MGVLKELIVPKVPAMRERMRAFLEAHGKETADKITWEQVLHGMRGVLCLPCFTSLVDPMKGLQYGDVPVCDYVAGRSLTALPERLFLRLIIGEDPQEELLNALLSRLSEPENTYVPEHVWRVIEAMADCHPMDMFAAALSALNSESAVRRVNDSPVPATDRWPAYLDDAVRLLAVLPKIVGAIYAVKYRGGIGSLRDDRTSFEDFGEALAKRLGLQVDWAADLMRLYLVLHADHESGNVSANTGRTVASSRSTPFQSFAAAMDGLAGPLHGLACQENLLWLRSILGTFGNVPDEAVLENVVRTRLHAKQLISGFGHAVLRSTDPRFTAFDRFAQERSIEHPLIQLVRRLHKVAPGVLRTESRAANTEPNVDAISGSVLFAAGLERHEVYTVLFGAARAIGIMAQLTLDSIFCLPIVRPKSVFFSPSSEFKLPA